MQLKEISELKSSVPPKFNWEDPLLIDAQLTEEEKIIQKTTYMHENDLVGGEKL